MKAETREITLRPGETAEITVSVERQGDYLLLRRSSVREVADELRPGRQQQPVRTQDREQAE